MIKIVIITISIFLTLFPVNFVFLPNAFSTRFILSLFGAIVWLIVLLSNKNIKNIKYNNITMVFLLTILISIWSSLCTSVFNLSDDYTFVKLPITISVMYFSSYLCIFFIKKFYKDLNFDLVTKYFIYAIILQSLLVIAQFINPNTASLLSEIQRLTERQVNISTAQLEDGSRFIGFGLLFYTASFFYGAALILIAFQLRYKSMTKGRKIVNFIIYLLVFFIGMGLSRSTIIGFSASLLIFIFPIKDVKSLTITIIKLILGLISTLLLILTIVKVFPSFTSSLEALINNAFDFVIAYINTGNFSSESASGTFDLLIYPNDLRTYFLGTGLYETYFSVGDYNYSDVGYLRLLYYFGLPGMILFFIIEIQLLRIAFSRNKFKPIYYSMLFILFVTNIKGLATLAIIAMLYALIPNDRMEINE